MMRKITYIVLMLAVHFQVSSQEVANLQINVGGNINTENSENGPRLSPDGKTLYFWRWRGDNQYSKDYGLDIFQSVKNKDGQWGKAKKMKYPFNTSSFNTIQSIGKNGNSVIVIGEFVDGEFEDNGFSISHKTKRGWSELETLKIDQFKEMALGMYYGLTMSNDGTVLIIHMNEEEDVEYSNLYVSFIKEDKTWSKPIYMGETINSEMSEISPFISSDGATLYFSSNREGGVGCFDIYMTSRMDDTWLNWTEPVNLGKTVNTSVCDMHFSIDKDEEYAYLGSLHNSVFGNVDIVRVALIDSLKPKNRKVILTSDSLMYSVNNDVEMVNMIADADLQNMKIPSNSNSTIDNFMIYPNPVEDNFFIEISGDLNDEFVITIISANGQLLLKEVVKESLNGEAYTQRYDVSDFASGVYIVSFNDGEVIISKRIIIR